MQLPPPLTVNEIDAIYLQMRNNGQNAIGELGAGYISIETWRERELNRIAAMNRDRDSG